MENSGSDQNIIMGSSDHRCNSHVALLAFPFGTHAAPLYSLASILASATPTSTFSFFSTSNSNSKLSQIPVPPNLTRYDVSDGSLQGVDVSPITNPQQEIDLFLKATPGNFRAGMEVAVRDGVGGVVEISCVVSDAFLWFAGKMAVEMRVPWIALWTGGTASLSSHIYTDDIRRNIGVGDRVLVEQGERSLAVIPGMSGLRVRDLPEGIVFGKLNSLFSLLLHRMGREIPNATAVALNTFQALDTEVLTQLNSNKLNNICFPIGPLNLITPTITQPDESNCLTWLDAQSPNSVVYIGFGTVMSPPPEELAVIAEALESTGVPFLWSLSDKLKAQLPSELLLRGGLVVPWAPQSDVLNHVSTGVFLTHCGWNSMTESICGGVPMICRPLLGDQRLNAREASEKWKIGLMVEESDGVLTKEWVSNALLWVLKSSEGRTMRERVVSMKEMAHEAVKHGGTSARSLDDLIRILTKMEF
ncbi:Flavonoid glucosyltransferase, family GT1 [Zostera marina]|uniref:Glycosyltransferase n=1 Tax=Zostera marina TaxID=29655 RepID=A0A0K9PQT4_ZOSMR|nr:Flavonoid glucosyltransferase, family GT1 [Zostera marina]